MKRLVMKLFKKTPPPTVSRQRPAPSREAAPVFAYRSQRSASQPGQLERQAVAAPSVKAGWRQRIAAIGRQRSAAGSLVILLIVIGLVLSYTGNTITVIRQTDATNSNFLQPDAAYQATARQSLRTSVFNLNKLTLNTTALRLALLSGHPELESVSVGLPPFGTAPRVTIKPYPAAAILASSQGSSFVVDQTGRVLVNSSQLEAAELVGLPVIQDHTATQLTLGQRALPSTTVRFVQTVQQAMSAAQVKLSSTVLASAYELDVTPAGKAYIVKFNLVDDAAQQAGTFLAVKQRLDREGTVPTQYIDVRIAERAYYK